MIKYIAIAIFVFVASVCSAAGLASTVEQDQIVLRSCKTERCVKKVVAERPLFASLASFKKHTSALFQGLSKNEAKMVARMLQSKDFALASAITKQDFEALGRNYDACELLCFSLAYAPAKAWNGASYQCFRGVHARLPKLKGKYPIASEVIHNLSSSTMIEGGTRILEEIASNPGIYALSNSQIKDLDERDNCPGLTGHMISDMTEAQQRSLLPECFSAAKELDHAKFSDFSKCDHQMLQRVRGPLHNSIHARMSPAQAANFDTNRGSNKQCQYLDITAMRPSSVKNLRPECIANFYVLATSKVHIGKNIQSLPVDSLAKIPGSELDALDHISDNDWANMPGNVLSALLAAHPSAASKIPNLSGASKRINEITARTFCQFSPHNQVQILANQLAALPDDVLEGVDADMVKKYSFKGKSGLAAFTALKIPAGMLSNLGANLGPYGDHPCSLANKKAFMADKHFQEAANLQCLMALPFRDQLTEVELSKITPAARIIVDPKNATESDLSTAIDAGFCKNLMVAGIRSVNQAAWHAFTSECLVKVSDIRLLKTAELQAFNDAVFSHFTKSDAAKLSDLAVLRPEQIAQLSSKVEASQHAAQLVDYATFTRLSDAQLSSLHSKKFLAAVPADSFRAISTKARLQLLDPVTLANVSSAQLKNIPADVLVTISKDQIARLSADALTVLNVATVKSALSDEARSALEEAIKRRGPVGVTDSASSVRSSMLAAMATAILVASFI